MEFTWHIATHYVNQFLMDDQHFSVMTTMTVFLNLKTLGSQKMMESIGELLKCRLLQDA